MVERPPAIARAGKAEAGRFSSIPQRPSTTLVAAHQPAIARDDHRPSRLVDRLRVKCLKPREPRSTCWPRTAFPPARGRASRRSRQRTAEAGRWRPPPNRAPVSDARSGGSAELAAQAPVSDRQADEVPGKLEHQPLGAIALGIDYGVACQRAREAWLVQGRYRYPPESITPTGPDAATTCASLQRSRRTAGDRRAERSR